jgi:pyrimidine deaminase RibD-like protein
MKIAELLRKLADLVDQNSTDGVVDSEATQPHAELRAVEVDHTDNTEPAAMVPPLQQKLELLKRAVDSVEPCPHCGSTDCHCGDEGSEDELSFIKRAAGVPVVAVAELSDDEPFEA